MAFQPINFNKENGLGLVSAPAPKAPTTTHQAQPVTQPVHHRHARHWQPYEVQGARHRRALKRGHKSGAAASPITSDVEMSDASTFNATYPGKQLLCIPATLTRPIPGEIDPDALVAIDRDLAHVPLEYVRAKIREVGASMLCSIANTQNVLCNNVPKEIKVMLNTEPSRLPTHIFAVWDKTNVGPRRMQMYPVHDIVFASHCTKFADLPPSKRTESVTEDGSVKLTLPVVSVGIPHRETFSTLQHFLYTGNQKRLLATLIPQPMAPGITPAETPRHFGETYTPSVLFGYITRTHGVYRNACALGVVDEDLYKVLQLAWSILMESFKHAEHSGVIALPPQ
ncbi:hypothetical protein AURDEDRAFT_158796 [Auricularia subglabra TFB-10046 SS5]|nr:hypothetical protein AURDEDRAFT_158796 [Auricularia subglabra TFB-10046 SS5]